MVELCEVWACDVTRPSRVDSRDRELQRGGVTVLAKDDVRAAHSQGICSAFGELLAVDLGTFCMCSMFTKGRMLQLLAFFLRFMTC